MRRRKVRPHVVGIGGILGACLVLGATAKVGSAALDRAEITIPGDSVRMPQFPGEEFVGLWAARRAPFALGCGKTSTSYHYSVPVELITRRGLNRIRRNAGGVKLVSYGGSTPVDLQLL